MKIEKAGNVEHEGINIRLRTAFKNGVGEEIYLEISAGVRFEKKERMTWIHIDHLFYLADKKYSWSEDFGDFIEKYNLQRNDYTEENIKALLTELGISRPEITYTTHEYRVHRNGGYVLGNEIEQSEAQQKLF